MTAGGLGQPGQRQVREVPVADGVELEPQDGRQEVVEFEHRRAARCQQASDRPERGVRMPQVGEQVVVDDEVERSERVQDRCGLRLGAGRDGRRAACVEVRPSRGKRLENRRGTPRSARNGHR